MTTPFRVNDSISISVGEKYYDLHNFFDFCGMETNEKGTMLTLLFLRNPKFAEQVPGNKGIRLIFRDVTCVEKSPGVEKGNIKNLDEIGFKNPTDKNLDWLVESIKSAPEDHIVFRFEGDEYIRFHSNTRLAEISE